jgi:hypothetical protein
MGTSYYYCSKNTHTYAHIYSKSTGHSLTLHTSAFHCSMYIRFTYYLHTHISFFLCALARIFQLYCQLSKTVLSSRGRRRSKQNRRSSQFLREMLANTQF